MKPSHVMHVAGSLFRATPVTTVTGLSLVYLALVASVLPEPLRLLGFYLFGLPSYLAYLVASVVALSLGTSPTWWLGLGLCLVVDLLVLWPVRRLIARAGGQHRIRSSSEG